MLYHLLVPLAQYNIAFNLFRFQTFRAAGAVVTAFLVAFYLGPPIIRRLRMLLWITDSLRECNGASSAVGTDLR